MKPLTICYITAREQPRSEWFFDSLRPQYNPGEPVYVIVIDTHCDKQWPDKEVIDEKTFRVCPKPTIWQGKHRLTPIDWWAVSNARNTGFCLCQTEWIAFCDDRCVLLPGWMDSIELAMTGNYVVAGAYEKRQGTKIESGIIQYEGGAGILSGEDCRVKHSRRLRQCPGQWLFSCNFALPLEWGLVVNGFDELMDSVSMEDVIFGSMIENNNFPVFFDPRMKIVEDRTPGELGTDMKRYSKELHPHDTNDKTHKLLHRLRHVKRAEHDWNLREIRENVLKGQPFPIPTQPTHDWFDNQPLSEMK